MGPRKKISVDGKRLKEAISKRGITPAEASRRCGYNESFFSGASYDGVITLSGAIALEHIIGVKREEYEVKPEAEKKPEPAPQTGGIDYNRMWQTIYSATFAAVKAAWENAPTLEETEGINGREN